LAHQAALAAHLEKMGTLDEAHTVADACEVMWRSIWDLRLVPLCLKFCALALLAALVWVYWTRPVFGVFGKAYSVALLSLCIYAARPLTLIMALIGILTARKCSECGAFSIPVLRGKQSTAECPRCRRKLRS
jgi:hypothetical protein